MITRLSCILQNVIVDANESCILLESEMKLNLRLVVKSFLSSVSFSNSFNSVVFSDLSIKKDKKQNENIRDVDTFSLVLEENDTFLELLKCDVLENPNEIEYVRLHKTEVNNMITIIRKVLFKVINRM